MRSLPQMRSTGFPVIFDATHSVQQPMDWAGHLADNVNLFLF